MIKLHNPNIQSSPSLIELYIVEFGSVGILILGKPDYSCLQYFKPTTTTKQLLIEENNQLYLNCAYRINLNSLRDINYQKVDIVLISDFKAYFLLPYILRQKKLLILLTQPMYEFGKLFSTSFLQQLKNQNRFCEKPDFIKQNEAFDKIQQQCDINIQQFAQIYEVADLNKVALHCEPLNHGQIYSHGGELEITPFSSGSSISECLWSLKSKSDGSQIVVLLNGSLQTWRHCMEIEVGRIQNCSYLVLGKDVSNLQEPSSSANPNQQYTQFISTLQNQLRCGFNVHLSLESSIHAIDSITTLNYHLGHIFRQLIVLDHNFLGYLKYTNSFVEYLNPIRASKIHNDPPEYPFSQIDKLVAKGLLSCGSVLNIAIQEKVPTKQILLRYKPAVFVHPIQFEYIHICEQKSKFAVPDQRPSPNDLQTWITKITPKRILSFQKGTSHYIHDKQIQLERLSYKTFPFTKPINPFQQYQLSNGIAIEHQLKKYRLIPKDWSGKLENQLKKQNINCQITPTSLKTSQSQLTLVDYTFQITSFSVSECEMLYQALESL